MSRLPHARPLRYAQRTFELLALLSMGSGCTSDPDAPGASGAGGMGGTSTMFGGIAVKLIEANSATGASAYTSLLGKFQDGPQPPVVPLEVADVVGDCALLVPSFPSCIPQCPSSAACTEDDVCTRFPSALNVGTIEVEGLGSAPFSMQPVTAAFAYQPPMTLANPPCEEGAVARATAEGIALESTCIAQLELTLDDVPEVRSGEPVPLSWLPPSVAGISEVHIVLDVAHHGGKKGEIVCNVPDTGSFEIPEPLVTDLVELGLAGFPTVVVTRVSAARGAPAHDVALRITSPIERLVSTAVTSCTSDTDCPTGTTCQVELVCR
jgi:hypothetical protein